MEVALGPEDQKAEASTTISGERAVVTKVHLTIRQTLSLLNPEVQAQVCGISIATGKPVEEILRN